MERLRLLNPQDVVLRRDLGICQLRHGQPGKAIDHLRSYLSEAADADDIEKIEGLLKNAVKLVAQWN
jgi:hypothetical protein